MFRKKAAEAPSLPDPPSIEAILEDLAKAEPDDVVFTVDLSDPQQLIVLASENSSENFQLPQRFKVCVCTQPRYVCSTNVCHHPVTLIIPIMKLT